MRRAPSADAADALAIAICHARSGALPAARARAGGVVVAVATAAARGAVAAGMRRGAR
jgi:hypothetical protein